MKVSLVATVKDARGHIDEFLDSVRAQTRPADEVVVVDGGSSDGTLEALERADGVTVLSEPGANIAAGRNIAVRAAAHDVIAVTDADCVLTPPWLERLVERIERGAAVAGGFYVPRADNLWQVWTTAHIPDAEEIRPGWMPSSRSLAFRREAFERAGGYPEWLDIGEDMYLNHRWAEAGITIELAPDAVALWRPRAGPVGTWRQYAAYAEGDARAGMYPRRHLVRFAAYGILAGALASRRPALIGGTAVAGAAYAARPALRTWRRLRRGPAARALAVVGVPPAMAFIDAAKMWGYVRGLAARRRSGHPGI